MLTIFYSTETLPKLKVHKAFILCPRVMYYQVRSCARWGGENTKAVLQPIRKHLSLKTCII